MAHVLLVDDEAHLRQVLLAYLGEQGHEARGAESAEEALKLARRQRPDIFLIDLLLPGMSGLELLRSIKAQWPDAACIVMTAFGSIRSAVDAIRAGGDDYLTKPFDNDALMLAIDKALQLRRLSSEVAELRSELASRYGFDDIVGLCPAMREVFRMMSRVSATDATVLILGESGTGKELVARGIHHAGRRRSAPFIAVNCSAIPSGLLEAEFFGYEKGAFTDAKETHPGKFEQAHTGTLFLDEIGDLPLDAQAKLLRVLQDREITRLGARRPIKLDVRILAATHRDLEVAVKTGAFREDLYWRLNVLSLRLPALRDRSEDLPLLIDTLLERFNNELGLNVRGICAHARQLLLAHDWPGNIRELENTLRRAIVLCDSSTISADDLPPRLKGEGDGTDSSGPVERMTLSEAVRRATERVERGMIQAMLLEYDGNRTLTAESLGINRKTLFNKLKLYNLSSEDEAEPD